jgi:hypothetical protein
MNATRTETTMTTETIQVGQIYRMRPGHKPHGSMGARVRVSRLFPEHDAVSACRWIETRQRFSSGGFSYPRADFLKLYELESASAT